MKILVAGGAGFLGSHLCERLLSEGHTVYCMDDLSTGRKLNIEKLLDNSNFTFTKYDITHGAIKHLNIDFDQIYNLACPASPPKYQIDPIRTSKISFLGTLNLLELAYRKNSKYFQASTSEVYGDPTVHPQNESYRGNVSTTGIRACYDEGKRIAETLCFDFKRQYGVDVKVARIFNTYGPNMDPDDGRVVSNFITQSIAGKDITIYGDGTQTRSFCYYSDLIDGIIKLMDSSGSEPINLGNPEEFTIEELARLVILKTQSASKIVYEDLPQDDPMLRCPDISKAKTRLNWTPMVPLNDGLDSTIEYFSRGI